MRKVRCVLFMLGVFAVPAWAGLASIEVVQAQGYTANYDHTTGDLEWSLGASATIYDDEGGSYYDGDVLVSATFSVVVDSSADGWAEGDFNTSSWSIAFNGFGGSMSGTLKAGETYHEVEGIEHPVLPIRQNENQLYGDALVSVDSWDFGTLNGGAAVWDAGDLSLTAKLLSQTLLPSSPAFGDYDTDSYTANSTTMWIYANETMVPEPMTICLLGLGGLMLRRRRA